jgi:hypothetical protein
VTLLFDAANLPSSSNANVGVSNPTSAKVSNTQGGDYLDLKRPGIEHTWHGPVGVSGDG